MTEVVWDASVAADSLVGGGQMGADVGIHSHSGIDIEVVSVLRRYVLRGSMPADKARETLDWYLTLGIARHPAERLLPRIWDLRHDISPYDAGYVALAEALGLPLVTLDRRLATTAGRYCDVIVP